MPRSRLDEAGDTLVEIIVAVLLIGAVAGAIFTTYTTAATASTGHRNLVTADVVLRDDAEATKAAVRTSCNGTGSTFTVTYAAPSGFTVNPLTAQPCPGVTTVRQVDLVVTMPNGHTKSLSIDVRTP